MRRSWWTDFMNLKIKPAQSFKCTHKGIVYIQVFMWMSTHTYMSIIYTMFLKKLYIIWKLWAFLFERPNCELWYILLNKKLLCACRLSNVPWFKERSPVMYMAFTAPNGSQQLPAVIRYFQFSSPITFAGTDGDSAMSWSDPRKKKRAGPTCRPVS
jgi:hypothetical protein